MEKTIGRELAFAMLIIVFTACGARGQTNDRYPNLQAGITHTEIAEDLRSNHVPLNKGNSISRKNTSSPPNTNHSADVGGSHNQVGYQKCTHCPAPGSACTPWRIPGLNSQPHCPRELGGCQCGAISCKYQMTFNPYWPYPLKPAIDQHRTPLWIPPNRTDYWDLINKIGELEMLPYKRQDNGYTGRNADCYGCLGASWYR